MPKEQHDNLSESLAELEKIAEWFESQEEVDVEKGIQKVRQGAELIKKSRARLESIENEFEDIQKSLEENE